jgi:hypothetical protein
MGCVVCSAADAGGGPGGLAARQLPGEQRERPHSDPGLPGEDQRHAAVKARQCLVARGASCTASSRPIPAEAPVIRTAPLSIGGRAFPATITSPSADHAMSILIDYLTIKRCRRPTVPRTAGCPGERAKCPAEILAQAPLLPWSPVS